MVLRACRYFGHTRDYWWASLTWPLYLELERQLAEEPPADRLLALYFRAQDWWEPPASAGAPAGNAEDDDGVWVCPLPDVTD